MNTLRKADSIYIYSGLGAGADSIDHTVHSLSAQFPHYHIKKMGAHDLGLGKWREDAIAFVMPGGADIYYAKRLKGKGNETISQYVREGGVYIGICAGAYYAAEQVLFDDGQGFIVNESRELKFIQGPATGPVSGSYDAASYQGATATLLEGAFGRGAFFLNGGPFFQETGDVLARYSQYDGRPAIVYRSVGKGKVLLSGVHFEYDPEKLDPQNPFVATLIPLLTDSESVRQNLMKYFWQLLEIQ